jgi:hypothetical protein
MIVPAFRPTVRAAACLPAVATMAMVVSPATVAGLRHAADLTPVAAIAALGGGAALAWAVDDQMADLSAATPVGNGPRLLIRLVIVAIIVVVAWSIAGTVAVVAGAPSGRAVDLRERVPELAAAAMLAMAIGTALVRRGEHQPGVNAVIGALLAFVTIAASAERLVWLPSFLSGPTHARWWWVALIGLVVAGRMARDPGRR